MTIPLPPNLIPGNKINTITSDVLDSPSLILSKDICKVILGNLDLADFDTTYGATDSIKESISQTIVSFPITRRNSNVLQVTGTDNKIYTFDGLLWGDNAKNRKLLLENLLNSGLPLALNLFYNGNIKKVLIKKLDFTIETSCKIRYSIELVEYTPEYLIQIGANLQSAYPDFTTTDPAQTLPSDSTLKQKCGDFLTTCSEPLTKISFWELINGTGLSDTTPEFINDLFAGFTECVKKTGITDSVYDRSANTVKQLLAGLYNKISSLLESNTYIQDFNRTVPYNFADCKGVKDINALREFKLSIFAEATKCMKVFLGDVNVSVPLFEKVGGDPFLPNNTKGVACLNHLIFEYLAKGLGLTGAIENYLENSYIEFATFNIYLSYTCLKWCNGSTDSGGGGGGGFGGDEDVPPPDIPFPSLPPGDTGATPV